MVVRAYRLVRLSCMEYFEIPALPNRVSVYRSRDAASERDGDKDTVWLSSDMTYEAAPRLSDRYYKFYDTALQTWFILDVPTANWKDKGLKAKVFRPRIRVKAPSRQTDPLLIWRKQYEWGDDNRNAPKHVNPPMSRSMGALICDGASKYRPGRSANQCGPTGP